MSSSNSNQQKSNNWRKCRPAQGNSILPRSNIERRSNSITSSDASSYSQPSTSSSYANTINSICIEQDMKKLVAKEQYLLSRNHNLEAQCSTLTEDISKKQQMEERVKAESRLAECENTYKNGKFTTAKNEMALVNEIGRLKAQIPRMLHWSSSTFDRFEDLSEALKEELKERKKLQNHIKANKEFLKQIDEAKKRAPNQTAQNIATQTNGLQQIELPHSSTYRPVSSTYRPVSSTYHPVSSTYRSISPVQQRFPSESSSTTQTSGFRVKVTNLPQDYDYQLLRKTLYGIFGTGGNSKRFLIEKLYITPSRQTAFITYTHEEDANMVVEELDRYRLGYLVLRVEHANARP
uniref:RRM domain-containing protein n=1 Tax=Acrobeloides nanus TaxID=290746 RepID=A0A914BX42_9BILA